MTHLLMSNWISTHVDTHTLPSYTSLMQTCKQTYGCAHKEAFVHKCITRRVKWPLHNVIYQLGWFNNFLTINHNVKYSSVLTCSCWNSGPKDHSSISRTKIERFGVSICVGNWASRLVSHIQLFICSFITPWCQRTHIHACVCKHSPTTVAPDMKSGYWIPRLLSLLIRSIQHISCPSQS